MHMPYIMHHLTKLVFFLNTAESMTKLKPSDLGNIVEQLWDVRSRWFSLGLQLQFNYGDLEAIKKDKRECSECFTELLNKWLKVSNPAPTWKSMINALNSRSVGILVSLVQTGTIWVSLSELHNYSDCMH